jgi:hypothetical protein
MSFSTEEESLMRVFTFGMGALALGLAAMLAVSGCSSSSTGDSGDDSGPKDKGPKTKSTAVKPGKGTVVGRVTLEGGKPDLAKLTEGLLEVIEKKAKEDAGIKTHCLEMAPEDQKSQQDWRISADGGIADAVVFLLPTSGTFFAEEESSPAIQKAKKEPAVVDQPHCAFVPHVVIHFPNYKDDKNKPQKTGQKFIVKNSAKISHNTKAEGQKNGFNETIGAGNEKEFTLEPEPNAVTISCGIHPWMNGFVWVLDTPYHAKTDKDGNFKIENVPEGKVNIVVWHAAKKFVTSGGAKGQELAVSGETKKDFTVKAD